MMVKYFQAGDKVKIYSSFHDQNVVYLSQVDEIDENGEVVVTAPIRLGRVVTLNKRRDYIFDFYGTNGIYRTIPEIVDTVKEGQLYFIRIRINPASIKKIQRRNYFRLDSLITIDILGSEHPTIKELKHEYPLPEEVLCVNISGGGMKFLSKNKYMSGEEIDTSFVLPVRESQVEFSLKGSVIDSEPLEDAANRFVHRIKFSSILPKQREDIIRYVFEQQVKQKVK